VSDFVRAAFAGAVLNGTITRFELRQRYAQHSLAILDMTVPSALLRTTGGVLYPEMTPVVLDWGRSATEQSRFYGYVNHPEVLTDTSGNPTVRYMCLGTSLRMNGAAPRSWTGVSPSFVVAEIARKHRLRALLHRSRRKLPTFTISTETDFQALQRLAGETGFRLWVDGGTVYFVDPNVLLTGAATSFVPQYLNVVQFSVTPGTLVPRDGGVVSEKVVNGRSTATQGAFTVRSDTVLKTRPDDVQGFRPPLTTVLPGQVGTYTEARDRIDAATRLQNWLTATARLPGAPMLRPGRLIWIDGPNVPIDHNGVWHVESTRHVMNISPLGATAHSTDVEVSRNQGDRPAYIRSAQVSGTPDTVGCVQRDGVFWESESLDVVYLN
jgi:hypothetical protein